jgi:hypothetical protein
MKVFRVYPRFLEATPERGPVFPERGYPMKTEQNNPSRTGRRCPTEPSVPPSGALGIGLVPWGRMPADGCAAVGGNGDRRGSVTGGERSFAQ